MANIQQFLKQAWAANERLRSDAKIQQLQSRLAEETRKIEAAQTAMHEERVEALGRWPQAATGCGIGLVVLWLIMRSLDGSGLLHYVGVFVVGVLMVCIGGCLVMALGFIALVVLHGESDLADKKAKIRDGRARMREISKLIDEVPK